MHIIFARQELMHYVDPKPGQIYDKTQVNRYRIRYQGYGAANLLIIYLNICYLKQVHDISVVSKEEWKVIIERMLVVWHEIIELTEPVWFANLLDYDDVEDYHMPVVDEWDDDIVERATRWYEKRTGNIL
jgi:hypothetical protein